MAVVIKAGPADQKDLIRQLDEAIRTLQGLESHVCYAHKVNKRLQSKWDAALEDVARLDQLISGTGRELLNQEQAEDLEHFLDYVEGGI